MAVRLYHPDFRARYEEEILRLHGQLDGEASTSSGPMSRAVRIAAEALRHGPATRFEYRQQRSRRSPTVGGRDMRSVTLDLRHALRMLFAQRAQSALLIGTLALAIGSGAAIFSVVDQVLLRPLSFGEPERLVRFWGVERGELAENGTIAYLDVFDWHDRSRAFEAVAAYDEWEPTLAGDGDPVQLIAATVSANYFSLLAVTPHVGRFFLPEEDEDGKDRVVVLGHSLWQSRYGGDRHIVGQTLLLNDSPHVVVGVAPPLEGSGLASDRSQDAQLWRPNGYLGLDLDRLPNRGSESWAGIGRLKAGWTLERAQIEVDHVASALAREYPESNTDRGVRLVPLQEQIVGNSTESLFLLSGAAGLLFLVALVNVAGVLLGRAAERLKDTALRAALGARRWDLLRRDLIEGALLSTLGCFLGVPLAWALLKLLLAFVGHALPRPVEGILDIRVVAFAVVTSVFAGILCSLPPSLSMMWRTLVPSLRSGSLALTGSRRAAGTRNFLVAAEVGLSLVLLVGAAVLSVGLWNLRTVDAGVQSSNLLTFQLRPARSSYPDAAALDGLYSRLQERLRALPGVKSVAVTNIVPLSGDFDGNGVWADDWDEKTIHNGLSAQTRTTSSGYFETMGIQFVQGQSFERSQFGEERVAVINRRLAAQLWPSEDPIGRYVRSSADGSEPIRIVGMVQNVKHLSLEDEAPAQIYLPRSQGLVVWQLRRATVVLRSEGDLVGAEMGLAGAVRDVVGDLDPNLPVANLSSMSQLIDRTVASPRLRATLTLAFGVIALLLTAVGIYAAISHAVTLRRREVAIRMALGAGRGQVTLEILRQTLALVGAGILFGGVLLALASPLLSRFVYRLDWSQAVAFGLIPVVLMIVSAVIATLAPVLRASRAEPTVVLREA